MSLVELGKQLLDAATRGDEELIKTLMFNGAPFTTDWFGTTPLHLAAQNGHIGAASVLICAGITIDTKNKLCRAPIHMASQKGHKEMVKLLLNNGSNVNTTDMLNMTSLHWAIEGGFVEIVHLLLQHGAVVEVKSKFDKTPLTIAFEKMRSDILKMLNNAQQIREQFLKSERNMIVGPVKSMKVIENCIPKATYVPKIEEFSHSSTPANAPYNHMRRSATPPPLPTNTEHMLLQIPPEHVNSALIKKKERIFSSSPSSSSSSTAISSPNFQQQDPSPTPNNSHIFVNHPQNGKELIRYVLVNNNRNNDANNFVMLENNENGLAKNNLLESTGQSSHADYDGANSMPVTDDIFPNSYLLPFSKPKSTLPNSSCQAYTESFSSFSQPNTSKEGLASFRVVNGSHEWPNLNHHRTNLPTYNATSLTNTLPTDPSSTITSFPKCLRNIKILNKLPDSKNSKVLLKINKPITAKELQAHLTHTNQSFPNMPSKSSTSSSPSLISFNDHHSIKEEQYNSSFEETASVREDSPPLYFVRPVVAAAVPNASFKRKNEEC